MHSVEDFLSALLEPSSEKRSKMLLAIVNDSANERRLRRKAFAHLDPSDYKYMTVEAANELRHLRRKK